MPRKIRMRPVERELAMLVSLERQLIAFVRTFSRATEVHEPLRKAIEHVVEQRTLLKMALAGDDGARRARRMQNDSANSMG